VHTLSHSPTRLALGIKAVADRSASSVYFSDSTSGVQIILALYLRILVFRANKSTVCDRANKKYVTWGRCTWGH